MYEGRAGRAKGGSPRRKTVSNPFQFRNEHILDASFADTVRHQPVAGYQI